MRRQIGRLIIDCYVNDETGLVDVERDIRFSEDLYLMQSALGDEEMSQAKSLRFNICLDFARLCAKLLNPDSVITEVLGLRK